MTCFLMENNMDSTKPLIFLVYSKFANVTYMQTRQMFNAPHLSTNKYPNSRHRKEQ